MNRWLYLTAAGLPILSVDWPCCTWSATGDRQCQPLQDAARALQGQAVDLLLPMELCAWLRSEPWPSRRQPDARSVAFAVEEQLSQALETLHLSIGARDRHARYPVLVVDRQRLARVLALLSEMGVEVRSVYVDADLMPGDQALGVWWFGRWLVGGGEAARLALTDEQLNVLKPQWPQDMQWRDERLGLIEADQWLSLAPGSAINLLQNEFAPRRPPWPWRLAGLALLAVLLLNVAAHEARIRFLDRQSHALQTRNEQQFKALYPEQSQRADLAQLNVLQSQARVADNGRIAALMQWVEQIIGASNVEVQRIEFHQAQGWKIQLTAQNFAELELLRERGRQQGVAIRLDSASQDRDRVRATLSVDDGV